MLRRVVWPLREVLSRTERRRSPPSSRKHTVVYLKDVYDHITIIMDNIETYRDILSGMLDIYLSSVSNRLNEVMKVLTIIATIFIPLTFIAGVYGMNFKNMPELEWPRGYYMALGLMGAVALYMVGFFWRKGWIGPEMADTGQLNGLDSLNLSSLTSHCSLLTQEEPWQSRSANLPLILRPPPITRAKSPK